MEKCPEIPGKGFVIFHMRSGAENRDLVCPPFSHAQKAAPTAVSGDCNSVLTEAVSMTNSKLLNFWSLPCQGMSAACRFARAMQGAGRQPPRMRNVDKNSVNRL
jgi:hypothetical protein